MSRDTPHSPAARGVSRLIDWAVKAKRLTASPCAATVDRRFAPREYCVVPYRAEPEPDRASRWRRAEPDRVSR